MIFSANRVSRPEITYSPSTASLTGRRESELPPGAQQVQRLERAWASPRERCPLFAPGGHTLRAFPMQEMQDLTK